MTNKIIRDAKKLDAFVTSTLKAYSQNGNDLHVATVSAIHIAAASGNADLLTRIYNGLRSNDQQALRLYVRRATILVGMIMSGQNTPVIDTAFPSEMVASFVKKGLTIDFKDKKFIVLQDVQEGRDHLAKLCEERFIEPDGQDGEFKDDYVFARNNVKEIKTIGDADALGGVLRAIKNVLENTSENRVINVSDDVKGLLAKFKTEASALQETRKQQANLANAA